MPLDERALLSWDFPPIEQAYDSRDTILYALGIGLGADPIDDHQLRFVYEVGLLALPTMGTVLGSPGFFLRDPRSGVDWRMVVHGEQGMVVHRTLPACGRIVSTNRVVKVVDKGAGRGALVYVERTTRDAANNQLLCVMNATYFCKADGGFGGNAAPGPTPHAILDSGPSLVAASPTLRQAALIYRLSGDTNPIHADPGIAKAAGFARPILHGLCTYGIAGYALLQLLCDGDPERFRRLDARFARPVFPGETIETRAWPEGDGKAGFRCRVVERDVLAIDNGYFEFND
jgi:acyl dehydratase